MSRPVFSAEDVRAAARRGELTLAVPPDAIVTPLARDEAARRGIELVEAVPERRDGSDVHRGGWSRRFSIPGRPAIPTTWTGSSSASGRGCRAPTRRRSGTSRGGCSSGWADELAARPPGGASRARPKARGATRRPCRRRRPARGRAARELMDDRIAAVTLLGGPIAVREAADRAGVDLAGIELLTPSSSPRLDAYVRSSPRAGRRGGERLARARPGRCSRPDRGSGRGWWRAARPTPCRRERLDHGGDRARGDPRDRHGARHRTVSSVFLMVGAEARAYTFDDCGVVADPTPDQLADIALASADTHRALTGQEPRVAMLSFSTKGSAKHRGSRGSSRRPKGAGAAPGASRGRGASARRGDRAEWPPQRRRTARSAGARTCSCFRTSTAATSATSSPQRFGGMTALGPLLQGLAAPMHDLSRGAVRRRHREVADHRLCPVGKRAGGLLPPADLNSRRSRV